jgi:hypothetical protein
MVGYKNERKYKPIEGDLIEYNLGFLISWDFCV